MARRHDVLHAQAVHRWCPHARDRCCACKSAARKLRRSSASRAASRPVVLCGRRAAWSGSTTFGSARCRSLRELKRIVPWPLWLGRVRGHSGPSIACMRGRCIILMHYRKDVSHPGLDRTHHDAGVIHLQLRIGSQRGAVTCQADPADRAVRSEGWSVDAPWP